MRSLWLVALLPVAVLRAGCGQSPISPNPSPSTSATPPLGQIAKPNATALENLTLIRNLERATGRGGLLIGITGSVAAHTGVVTPGGGWTYVFAQPQPTGLPRSYAWFVDAAGYVGFADNVADTGRREYVEIGPSLALDSPEAVRRGREYGAQPYVDRHLDTRVTIGTRSVAGRVVWEMTFTSSAVPCAAVQFAIDATTGALLFRDLFCLQQ